MWGGLYALTGLSDIITSEKKVFNKVSLETGKSRIINYIEMWSSHDTFSFCFF